MVTNTTLPMIDIKVMNSLDKERLFYVLLYFVDGSVKMHVFNGFLYLMRLSYSVSHVKNFALSARRLILNNPLCTTPDLKSVLEPTHYLLQPQTQRKI